MFLVGIAGGSGSGKTTFAKKIIQRADHPDVALIHMDSYYLHELPRSLQVHGEPNFDHPEAFDWNLMRAHLELLKDGKSIECPIYDYKLSRRTGNTETVGPCKVILLEGLYTLWDVTVRNLFDMKLFLHVDADIRFIRRLHRDVRERGRTLDGIIRQYYDSVRPMHREFLESTKQFADLIVGEETDLPADVIAARIKQLVGEGASL